MRFPMPSRAALAAALLLAAAPSPAAAQPPALFEKAFSLGMARLVAVMDRFDGRYGALDAGRQRQAQRGFDRLASSLYRLCSSKDDLVRSLSTPLATDAEIRADGYRIEMDLDGVRQRFDAVGELLLRRGDSASVADERAIREGLVGKAVAVDRVLVRLREPGFDRAAVVAEATRAATLCRQAQGSASRVAARTPGA